MSKERNYKDIKDKKQEYFFDDDFTNVCSSTDCTGVVPSAPTSDAELDAYLDLYQFQPRVTDKNINKKTQNR